MAHKSTKRTLHSWIGSVQCIFDVYICESNNRTNGVDKIHRRAPFWPNAFVLCVPLQLCFVLFCYHLVFVNDNFRFPLFVHRFYSRDLRSYICLSLFSSFLFSSVHFIFFFSNTLEKVVRKKK